MINREVFQKDPGTRKLVNEGVANVNDERNSQALAVLRYELETFVCDGQYQKGMLKILEVFLKNIGQAQQPGVWVSGFYGSGKSHFVKMLRALWLNTRFEDGATARGIANLPQDIADQLMELNNAGKKHGGLHAASGTLGAGASGSVRLALLRIIFKSVGLPEHYHLARFVMWLRKEGIYDQVRAGVEAMGLDWNEELDNFYVAEGLHDSLVQVKSDLFASSASLVQTLNNWYPFRSDVSRDEMITAIRQALTCNDRFPLTLVVLDEVQQFIGEDSQRSLDVQLTVEACCEEFGGKLLFVGTGQTAVTGTSNLKKLEGRFTIPVELSDKDVDAVIRKVILAKKPEAKEPIDQVMTANLGEISRHLAGTTIGHRQDDISCFSQDYPILPVRRRFWEIALRVIDSTGTDSQVRNQLSLIFKAIQSNMDRPVGSVVPADYLLFDVLDRVNQTRGIPAKAYRLIKIWSEGAEEQRLMARASGLVFLINKIGDQNKEIGIHATIDSLADLLVEDLASGSAGLRAKLPSLLDKCELLMRVGDEYRIQTEESTAWNDEFRNQQSALSNEAHRVEAERDDRIRARFGSLVRGISLTQGSSKVIREVCPFFGAQLPPDADQRIHVWVRDGWSADENSVRADARQAGNLSPTVFVFIPRRSADDLRHHLITYKAALATLDKRGVPNTPEGTEARAAMETTRQTADGRIRELLDDSFSGARVFQGGGNEILGNDLSQMLKEASVNALQRLFPNFNIADHTGWAKAYEKAQKGAPDALKSVGDEGEPARNSVCKAILASIAGGKRGAEIRTQFESQPYGWSRDAVDGALQVMLVAGLIRALDERGKHLDPRDLERKAIGKVMFKVESTTVTADQRIQVRKLMQKMGVAAKSGEELVYVPQFLQKLIELAERAGGDAPKPVRPNTAFLDEIRLTSGNEQLIALFNRRDELVECIENWTGFANCITARFPNWLVLKRLMSYAVDLPDSEVVQAQMKTIEQQRQLLEEPDLVAPLVATLTQLLRDELNEMKREWNRCWSEGEAILKADGNWNELEPEQRHGLRFEQKLVEAAVPTVSVETTDAILKTLDAISLSAFGDRIAAMPARFDQVLLGAARMMEPEVQEFSFPGGMLRNEQDVDAWVEDVRQKLKSALQNGPIAI